MFGRLWVRRAEGPGGDAVLPDSGRGLGRNLGAHPLFCPGVHHSQTWMSLYTMERTSLYISSSSLYIVLKLNKC